MTCQDARALIDPYIDGELTDADAEAVRQHLAGCAECTRDVRRRESLARLLRTAPYHAVPDRVRARVRVVRVHRNLQRLALAAGVLLAIGAGAFTLVAARAARATSMVAAALVDRHVAALVSARTIDVRSSNQHTVKPWFQGRLDFSPPVVDLAPAGFPLVGGRVDAVAGRRVAVIVFARRDHVIDLFVWPDDGGREDARTVRGFQERHWRSGGMSLWAVSDLNGAELAEFTRAFEAAR